MFRQFLNRSKGGATSPSEEEKQGFLCPECHRNFGSIDELSDHHIRAHPPADFEESFGPKTSSSFNGDLQAKIKNDIADMDASLQEERWYSAELNKELERVQAENESLKSSVQGRNGKEQLESISKKAADLAVTVAQLSAELDEERGKSGSLEHQLTNLQRTNEELCESQMSLQAKLVQSTSTDDVEVLKQELAKGQVQLDAILTSHEREMAVLREKLDAATLNTNRLNDKLDQRDITIGECQRENNRLQNEVTRLGSEVEKEQLGTSLITSQHNQSRERVEALESKCSRLADEVKTKEEEKTALFEKFSQLTSKISDGLSESDSAVNSEIKQLTEGFSEFQISLQQKDSRNTELSQEITELNRSLHGLTGQLTETQGRLAVVEGEKSSLETRVRELQGQLESTSRELGEKGALLETQSQQLASLNTQLASLTTERDSLSKAQEDLTLSVTTLEGEVSCLRTSLSGKEAELEAAETEADARYKEQCEKLYELDHKLTSVRGEHTALTRAHEETSEAHRSFVVKNTELESAVVELTKARDEAEGALAEREQQAAGVEGELAGLKEEAKEAEKREEGLREQLELSSCCVGELNARVERKDEMLLQLNSKIQKLEGDLAKPCTMCQNYEARLTKSHARTQELQNSEATLAVELSETRTELTARQEEVAELSGRIDVIEYDLERERENAVNTESALEQTKRELEESKSVLTGQVRLLEESVRGADVALQERQAALTEQTTRASRLEEELRETERALQEKAEISKQEIANLSENNKQLIAQKMVLHEEMQQLNDDLEHSMAQQCVLREKEREVREELEGVVTRNNEQLTQKDAQVRELAAEMLRLKKSHDLEMGRGEAELAGLRQKLRDSQGVVDELNKECERLYSKMTINEATMENLLDERKLLQKSVLDSEDRLSVLSEEKASLSKELEKTRTTLNEIAQEHSHLLYQQEKKNNRKWEEDAEVTFCRACFKEFGVSIRKHHCRNCGAIFCDECTPFRSSTPASKAKVRVCGPCNKELNP